MKTFQIGPSNHWQYGWSFAPVTAAACGDAEQLLFDDAALDLDKLEQADETLEDIGT